MWVRALALSLSAAAHAAVRPTDVGPDERVLVVADLTRAAEHYASLGSRVARRSADQVVLGARGGARLVLWTARVEGAPRDERVESFLESAGERRVLREQLYVCRVGVEPAGRGTRR